MPKVTYDTNIFINRKPRQLPLPGFYMSVVVLQELLAGAPDESAVKELNAARQSYRRANRLLVPTEDDWWEVGKVINLLQRRRKSKQGLIPRMSPQEKYRITNDVLIARTARRAGVTIVTDNVDDFKKISQFCNVTVIRGSVYFKTN